jgi:hypothetical protein
MNIMEIFIIKQVAKISLTQMQNKAYIFLLYKALYKHRSYKVLLKCVRHGFQG